MTMQRRPGATLLEVLVALFIMAVGMLALLTLFPLAAISMGQALQDDRAASAATCAENVALAMDIRHDPLVVGSFTAPSGMTALKSNYTGPSYPVYVDPWGYLTATTPVGAVSGTTVGIPRVSVNLNTYYPKRGAGPLSTAEAARLFSLPDDITFTSAGIPDLTTGSVQRGGSYTWAYLLRCPQAWSQAVVSLSVVAYSKRPIQSTPAEFAYTVLAGTGTEGTNSVTLTWSGTKPPAYRGTWVLDTTQDANGLPYANYYRVVSATDVATNEVQLELETNLKNDTAVITVMQDVIDVSDKGIGWQP
jgi:hypothetical protein